MSDEFWKELKTEFYRIQNLQRSVMEHYPEWRVEIAMTNGNTLQEMFDCLNLTRGDGPVIPNLDVLLFVDTRVYEGLKPNRATTKVRFLALTIDGTFYTDQKRQRILNMLCTRFAQNGFSINQQEINRTSVPNTIQVSGGAQDGIATDKTLDLLEKTWDYLIAIRHPWLE